MTRVVHHKREFFDVYIGRPGFWGNPFEIGQDGDRETVIKKFRQWILSNEPEAALRRLRLHELKGKVLGCWCSPQACHGDVLAELAERT